jgi:TM2 domain-containing membrane protein YozV
VAEAEFEKPLFCSRCGQPVVVAGAQYCKQCGAALTVSRILRHDPGFSPILALVLSILPGLGHIYRGKVFRGIGWFFGVAFAWGISPGFGILIHFICAANAAFSGVIREDVLVRPPMR